MSNEAITWALAQPVKHSTAKFVLVVMANHADKDLIAFPSVASLVDATSQDRKTVLENLKRLIALGYLQDTGMRKGSTCQVIVYRLKSPENGTAEGNNTGNGTVPKFPRNSTEIPYKESQISVETVPKTGHGNQRKPKETKGNQNKAIELPYWLPEDLWKDWVDYRKSIKAGLSEKAAVLCIAKLSSLRDAGNDPKSVIEQSIMSGKWTGLFEIKPQARGSPNGYESARDKARRETIEGLTGKKQNDQRTIDV